MTQGKYYTIDSEKLADVVEIFNRDTDGEATDEIIELEICADWNEGEEHQEWIDSATAPDIASWLATFYPEQFPQPGQHISCPAGWSRSSNPSVAARSA